MPRPTNSNFEMLCHFPCKGKSHFFYTQHTTPNFSTAPTGNWTTPHRSPNPQCILPTHPRPSFTSKTISLVILLKTKVLLVLCNKFLKKDLVLSTLPINSLYPLSTSNIPINLCYPSSTSNSMTLVQKLYHSHLHFRYDCAGTVIEFRKMSLSVNVSTQKHKQTHRY